MGPRSGYLYPSGIDLPLGFILEHETEPRRSIRQEGHVLYRLYCFQGDIALLTEGGLYSALHL